MRILYITPAFQHPTVRGPNRHYHFVRELSQRHKITLLTLTRSKVSDRARQEMTTCTEQIMTFSANGASNPNPDEVLRKLPLIGKRMEKALRLREGIVQMKRAFTQLTKQESYDVVLFHGKSVFPVIEDWNDLPIVVDFCDATSMRIRNEMRYAGMARFPLRVLRYLQVRQVEKKLVMKTPHLAFISARDREAILGPDNRSEVVPNGVDIQYWKRQANHPESNCLIFTGVMNYTPNEDAALYLMEKILPLVRRSVSNLQVLIVGRDPSRALLEQARHFPDVIVTGTIDDMRPYLERATLCVAPLRYASGMQNKVLEAMAMEVPVITTSIVAAGLRLNNAEPPICVADGEARFAERIVRLLAQAQERSRLAIEGRRFVENNFVWSRSAEKLERMCAAALETKRRGDK
jgi:glycosyltransferase involved in cell wall biosynthesis